MSIHAETGLTPPVRARSTPDSAPVYNADLLGTGTATYSNDPLREDEQRGEPIFKLVDCDPTYALMVALSTLATFGCSSGEEPRGADESSLAGPIWHLDLRLSGAEIRCGSQTEPEPWAIRLWLGSGYQGFRQKSPGICAIAVDAPAGSVIQLRVALSKPRFRPHARGIGRARAFIRVRGTGSSAQVRELARIELSPDRESFTTALRIPFDAAELQLGLEASDKRSPTHPLDWTDLALDSTAPDFAYGEAWTADVDTALEPFFEAAGIRERAPKRRLLVIGLDGADWQLMQPLLDAGEMPNLRALRDQGRSGILRSTPVPESAMAWGAIATGVSPGISGNFSFDSAPTARRSFWHLLGDSDLYSVVVAVPKAAIDRPLNGLVVGDWTKEAIEEFTTPPELAPHLRQAGYTPNLVRTSNVGYFEAHMTKRTAVVRKLLDSSDWDLAFVVYEYADTVGHRFGLYCEEWNEVYRSVDRQIGSVLESIDSDTTVMVISDHGWKRFPRSFNLNVWLEQNGFEDWRGSMVRGANVASIVEIGAPIGRAPTRPLTAGREELERLRRKLEAATHPDTKERIVTRIRDSPVAFPGPLANLVPGRLFVEFLPDLKVGHAGRPDHAFSAVASDHHSFDGIYLLAGPGIEPGSGPQRSVLDVAPSVLRYFGIAAPADFEGRSMDDFGQLGALSPPGSVVFRESPADATEGISPALEESLRSLGYIE